MKTISYLLMSLVLSLILFSCSDQADGKPINDSTTNTQAVESSPVPETEPKAAPSLQINTVDPAVDDFVKSVESKLSSYKKEERDEGYCDIVEYIDEDDMVVKRILACTDGAMITQESNVYYDYGRPQLVTVNYEKQNALTGSGQVDPSKTQKIDVRVYIADGSLALKGTTVDATTGKIMEFPKELEETWTQIMDFDE